MVLLRLGLKYEFTSQRLTLYIETQIQPLIIATGEAEAL